MQEDEKFVSIPGRSSIQVKVKEGVITIHNCNPGKVFVNV